MDLATAFALTVARRPEARAIVDGGVARTYAQWHAELARMAGGLARLGLAPGDRLLVLLKNRYETTVLYWACQSLGVVFTPLNWRARAAEVTFCLEDSDAKAVAFEEASTDSVREALAQCGREGLPRIIVAAGRSEFRRSALCRSGGERAAGQAGRPRRAQHLPHALHLGHHRAAQGRAADTSQ